MDARKFRDAWFVRLLAGAAALLAGFAFQNLRHGDVAILVDADIQGGSAIELFHNDLWSQSQQQPIKPGRQIYRFGGLPPKLWSLRLDPTDGAEARIRLYSVSIEKHGRELQSFGTAALRSWKSANVTPAPVDLSRQASFQQTRLLPSGDVAEFKSLNSDPILFVPGSFDFTNYRDVVSGWFQTKLNGAEALFAAMVLIFLAAGTLPWRGVRQLVWTVFLPAAVIVLVIAQRTLSRVVGPNLGKAFSAAEAVGNASYRGYPKTSDFRLYFTMVGLGVSLGFVAGLVFSRIAPPGPAPADQPAPPETRWNRRNIHAAAIASLALLILYALATFPPLAERLQALQYLVHPISYDETNNFSWEYFVHRRWMPFRDFWYPYGSFSGFYDSGWFPWGLVYGWVHETILLGIAGWALYRITWPSTWWGTGILAVILGGVVLGYFTAQGRYFIALDLGLVALAARARSYRLPDLIFLAVFGSYAFAMEPNQVFYAGLPAMLLGGLDLWRLDPSSRSAIGRRFALASAVFALGVGVVLLNFWVRGQLGGFFEFLGQMGAISTYGSIPADFSGWFKLNGTDINLVLWGPLLLLGCAATVFAWRRELDPLVASCLVLGLTGALSFIKFLVRPHIASQIAIFSVVGLLLAAFRLVPRLQGAQRLVLLASVGVLAVSVLGGRERATAAVRFHALEALPHSLAVLGRGDFTLTELSYYEDEQRYPDKRSVMSRLKQLASPEGGSTIDEVFDLGDDSTFYVALRQKPPYYITFYNSSPLEAQERTLAWLEKKKPKWLVWRPSFTTFDEVPNLVRVPLLYQAAISNYASFERVGDFEILRRRDPGAPIDVGFWADRLGTSIDLGAVPAISGLQGATQCSAEPCIEALRVQVETPLAGNKRVVHLTVGGKRFEVTFTEQRGQKEYYLYLDRLWFYGGPRRGGMKPEITGDAGPGSKTDRLLLSTRGPILW
jgi:hypothetical protein